jgi:hypothetical protein
MISLIYASGIAMWEGANWNAVGIRRINIKDSEAEIEYTCPIGFGGIQEMRFFLWDRLAP